METRLSLKYSGPSVDAGLMDIYQVSANMIAFSEFVVVASKITYGDKVEVKVEVSGFEQGSFLTSMVFSIANHAIPLFATFTPSEVLAIINESFALWKHLKGDVPASIKQDTNQSISIENNSGQVIQVKTETFNLVMNEKASDAIRQFVKNALADKGVDSLEIFSENKTTVAKVNQTESDYFDVVIPTESVTSNISKMFLVIEAPVFKDGNKWRFSDGQNSFYADILDADFLASVDAGEQFGKGDLLKVDLRIKQEQTGTRISAERFVEKVHEHKKKVKLQQNNLDLY